MKQIVNIEFSKLVHRCGAGGSTQQAQVRSLVGTSFLGEVFSVFILTCKTKIRKL